MPDLVARLSLLTEPTRARIVAFLADPVASCCRSDEGVCGCDLEAFLGVGQSTVSHHMKRLVEGGLVDAEKRGRWTYYRLIPTALRDLANHLSALADAAELRDPTDVEPLRSTVPL